MKKLLITILLAVSTSQLSANVDLSTSDGGWPSASAHDWNAIDDHDFFFDNSNVKFNVISVSSPSELTAAIQTAARDVSESTIIEISGTITGNFVVPPTVNPIELSGQGTNPTISGGGSGIPLTVNLGANVIVKNLTITGAGGDSGYGIANFGVLEIHKTTVTGNANEGGVLNSGDLFIKKSTINNNTGYGIVSQAGGVLKVIRSSVSSNTSTGIYIWSGEAFVLGSTINENGDDGFYNYYGTSLTLKKSAVNQNTGYGLENIYSSLTSISDDCTINNNTSGGIYNEGTTSVVENTTIANNIGKGIYNYEYAVLKLVKSKVLNNSSSGIYNSDTVTLFVEDSTFQGNSSTSDGGAIYNDSSSVGTVSNTIFSNNNAVSGGAVYNANLFTVKDSTINNNTASGNGGGIYNAAGASVVVRDSKIHDNTTPGDGGGVYSNGTASVIDSNFYSNSALKGGGLANITPGSLTLIESNVKYNTATFGVGGGGGIYSTGTLDVIDSNVVNNTPDQIAP